MEGTIYKPITLLSTISLYQQSTHARLCHCRKAVRSGATNDYMLCDCCCALRPELWAVKKMWSGHAFWMQFQKVEQSCFPDAVLKVEQSCFADARLRPQKLMCELPTSLIRNRLALAAIA